MVAIHLVEPSPAYRPNNAKTQILRNLDKPCALLLFLFSHTLKFYQQQVALQIWPLISIVHRANSKCSCPHLEFYLGFLFFDQFNSPKIRTCLGCKELAWRGTGNIRGAAASSIQNNLKLRVLVHYCSRRNYVQLIIGVVNYGIN